MSSFITYLLILSGVSCILLVVVFFMWKKEPKPKYICSCCKYKHLEKSTPKKVIKRTLKVILILFIAVTSTFGSLATYNFLASGIYDDPNLMVSIGGFYAGVSNIFGVPNYNGQEENFKAIAINLTRGCDSDYCRSKEIYSYLVDNFEYELGSNVNPMEIWEEKSGDCDEMTYLYMALLKSIGIDSRIQCWVRGKLGHCYTTVKLKDQYIKADITMKVWEEHEK